jgi:hypothetical protein
MNDEDMKDILVEEISQLLYEIAMGEIIELKPVKISKVTKVLKPLPDRPGEMTPELEVYFQEPEVLPGVEEIGRMESEAGKGRRKPLDPDPVEYEEEIHEFKSTLLNSEQIAKRRKILGKDYTGHFAIGADHAFIYAEVVPDSYTKMVEEKPGKADYRAWKRLSNTEADPILKHIKKRLAAIKQKKSTQATRIHDDVRADIKKYDTSGKLNNEEGIEEGIKKDEIAARRAYNRGAREKAAQIKTEQAAKAELLRQNRKRKKIFTDNWERMVRASRSKNIDIEYLKQIQDIVGVIDPVGRMTKTQKKIDSLNDFVERETTTGEMIEAIDQDLLQRAKSIPFDQFTVEEFQELADHVATLAHLGRLKKKLLTSKDKREFEAILAEMIDNGYGTWGKTDKVTAQEIVNNKTAEYEGKSSAWVKYRARLAKPEFILRQLDGWKKDGPNQQLFRGAYVAENIQLEMMGKIDARLLAAFEGFDTKWANEKSKLPGLTTEWTNSNKLGVYLHAQNPKNRFSLREGYQLTDKQIDTIIGSLTEAEVALAEEILNVYEEEIWPALSEKYEELYGVPLPKEGRYFPLYYDPKLSTIAAEMGETEAAQFMFNQLTHRTKMSDGMIKARQGKVKMAPLLDLAMINASTRRAVHWISHISFVRDANKVFRHPKYQEMVTDTMGKAYMDELRGWVSHLAAPKGRDANALFDRGADYLRRNTTIVALGFKATVSAKQLLSLWNTLESPDVANKQVLKAVGAWARSPGATKRFMMESSQAMANRTRTLDKDVGDLLNRQFDPLQGKYGNIIPVMKDASMWMIKFTDGIAVNITWNAGYREIIDGGGTHAEAVEHADGIVRRTQPAAAPKDLSPIQRGTAIDRLVSMFYTFMNTVYNLMGERWMMYKAGQMGLGRLLASFLMILAIPSILASQITVGLRERRWLTPTEVLIAPPTFGVATLPWVRDFFNAVKRGVTGEYGGYDASPAVNTLEKALRGVGRVGKRIREWDAYDDMFDVGYDAIDILSPFGIPGGQLKDSLKGAEQLATGQTKDPSRLVFPEKGKKKKSRSYH